MPGNPLRQFFTRRTVQSEPIPLSDQVPNSAGGYSFALDDWARLGRFLILGVDGPSYYASERQLVVDNAGVLLRCIAADGSRTIDEIVEISEAGRSPRQQPVIFALAACCAAADPDVRRRALDALPRVCRTGTHLFLFTGYVEQFRGWGRGLRRAVGDWYREKDPDDLALQLIKYQRREGWSHRDVLRLAKPAPARDGATDVALRWAVGKLDGDDPANMPRMIAAYRAAHASTSPQETAQLALLEGLPWEALPSEHLASPVVWEALLPTMGLGALIRNLGRLSANGTLVGHNHNVDTVVTRLGSADALRGARIHPIQVLSALATYRMGRGQRGTLSWAPVPAILDALDRAFSATFVNVEPAGKRTLLALDISGSMAGGTVAGVIGLTPRLASTAMAAMTLATEPKVDVVAFSSVGSGAWEAGGGGRSTGPLVCPDGLVPLPLSARQRLDDMLDVVTGLPMGGTDCSLPMRYALDRGLSIDTFVIYTDSETWAGPIHPAQALVEYRQRTAIPARLIVVGMVSNGFSIADPADAGMLDVVGFDTAAPAVMADFSAGRL